MKKLFVVLMFCLIGCESKTEQELKQLQAQKTELISTNKLLKKEIYNNNKELETSQQNWNRAVTSQQEIETKVATKQKELQTLENEKAVLLDISKQDLQNYSAHKNDKPKIFILKLKIKQRSYSLNPWTHAKNAMNAMEFEIPVNEEYYNHHNVGDELASDFRVGSAIMHGAMGELVIRVSEKRTAEY